MKRISYVDLAALAFVVASTAFCCGASNASSAGLLALGVGNDLRSVDVATGRTTLVAFLQGLEQLMFPASNNPEAIAFYQSRIYGITLTHFLEIDPESGEVRVIGDTGFRDLQGLAASTDGRFYATGLHGEFIEINPVTGVGQLIRNSGTGATASNLAFGPDGRLYATVFISPYTDVLATISVDTGVASLIGETGYHSVSGLAFSGGQLYGLTFVRDLIAIDPESGAGSLVGTDDSGALFVSLTTTSPSEGTLVSHVDDTIQLARQFDNVLTDVLMNYIDRLEAGDKAYLFVSGGVFDTLEVAIYFDLADLAGLTNDGVEGYVTTYVNFGANLGICASPVNAGIVATPAGSIDSDPPRMDFVDLGVTARLLTFTANTGNLSFTQGRVAFRPANVSFTDVTANPCVSGGGIEGTLAQVEVRISYILDWLHPSFIGEPQLGIFGGLLNGFGPAANLTLFAAGLAFDGNIRQDTDGRVDLMVQ